MFLTRNHTIEVRKPGFTAYIYNTKQQCGAVNAIFVRCDKGHERVRVRDSHRIYFVLEGTGSFTVGSDERTVEKYDVVIIEPGVPYSYQGTMSLFEVNYPATDELDEVPPEEP